MKKKRTIWLITPDTPQKLAEIIRDTWPMLYRPPTDFKNEKRIRTNRTSERTSEEPEGSTRKEGKGT